MNVWLLEDGDGCSTKGGEDNYWDHTYYSLRIKWSVPPSPYQRPRCRNSMLQQVATAYGFQISGWKRRDEYKLETACCDRFGSAGSAFCGQSRGNIHSVKTAANAVQVVIEPWLSPMFARIFFILFITSFIPPSQTFCVTNTHTALCSQLNLCIKRKKKQLL